VNPAPAWRYALTVWPSNRTWDSLVHERLTADTSSAGRHPPARASVARRRSCRRGCSPRSR
jgi:hypothetical protein